MYKDKNKQREMDRIRQQRDATRAKGVTFQLSQEDTDKVNAQAEGIVLSCNEWDVDALSASGSKGCFVEAKSEQCTRLATILGLSKITAKQLYFAIDRYPYDTRVNSPEHREMTNMNTVMELRRRADRHRQRDYEIRTEG